jgi:adenylate kinase
MRVVFVGPPGSGKGTQATLLRERLGLEYIGTGEILRDAVTRGTDVGNRAKPYIDQGQLVPDSLVNDLVAERLRSPGRPERFVLDGYPRNAAQARSFDALLRELSLPLRAVVLFRIDDDLVVQRMLARKRADDTEETARIRVRLFRDTARELVGHYRQQGLIHEVNADAPIEHLYYTIAGLLQPRST